VLEGEDEAKGKKRKMFNYPGGGEKEGLHSLEGQRAGGGIGSQGEAKRKTDKPELTLSAEE